MFTRERKSRSQRHRNDSLALWSKPWLDWEKFQPRSECNSASELDNKWENKERARGDEEGRVAGIDVTNTAILAPDGETRSSDDKDNFHDDQAPELALSSFFL